MKPQTYSRDEVAEMVASMARTAPSEGEIEAAMDTLQKIADTDSDFACSLMADLWPIASNAYMHDVCDSISLWIVDHRSPAVVSKLTQLSVAYPDPQVRKHWIDLLSNP
ncbi:MAG: hypothetical protein ACAH89_07180 [Rariglobus sp.]|nr:hypothetical protein [Rariglobus sp.]